MVKTILIACCWLQLAFAGGPDPDPNTAAGSTKLAAPKSQLAAARESELVKAVERQEQRHYDLHRFYIPVTQSNLQWLASTVGAKPDEAVFVWKLMRDWEDSRWLRNSTAASAVLRSPS